MLGGGRDTCFRNGFVRFCFVLLGFVTDLSGGNELFTWGSSIGHRGGSGSRMCSQGLVGIDSAKGINSLFKLWADPLLWYTSPRQNTPAASLNFCQNPFCTCFTVSMRSPSTIFGYSPD
jgi:hypothetical protein